MRKVNSLEFDGLISSYKGPYLLKFGSKTCGPCNTMGPVLEKLSEQNPDFKILEIDTDESPELAALFSIRSIPALHFCKDREILYSLTGITPYRDLQYIVDNIDSEYFKEHGEFAATPTKKSYFTAILMCSIIAFIALLMIV